MKKVFHKIFSLLIIIVLITIIFISLSNKLVEKNSINKTFYSTENIPYNKVGLLLGTSKYLKDGRINAYYAYRITAAKKLFEADKIDFILVSGDNSTKKYNEPTTIQNDLLEAGIPTSSIFLDYAGFRTLDSVVRSKEIFGQDSITVISQKFHNERAIYIAKQKGIDAIGYNARDVKSYANTRIQIRESFARIKMIIDLLLNIQPKFLGEKIEIR